MSPHPLTPEQLQTFIQLTHARFVVAFIILLGMIAIMLGSICLALRLRKTGLFFIAIYGGLMSFLGVGFCYIFGPIILTASLAGIAREWLFAPRKPAAA